MTERSPSTRSSKTKRGSMEQTYHNAVAAAGKALETAETATSDAAKAAAKAAGENPVAILAGGVAIGMLAGAFIPTTKSETKLLGPTGKRLKATAAGAAQAAKDAGKAELDNLGLSRAAAKDQVGKLIGGVLQALASAGEAATNTPATKTKPTATKK